MAESSVLATFSIHYLPVTERTVPREAVTTGTELRLCPGPQRLSPEGCPTSCRQGLPPGEDKASASCFNYSKLYSFQKNKVEL